MGRLQREQETIIKENQLREALRRSKQKVRLQRSGARLLLSLQQNGDTPEIRPESLQVLKVLLRRKSLARAVMAHPGIFLTLQRCVEEGRIWGDPHKWRPPRTKSAEPVFRSLINQLFIRFQIPPVLHTALVRNVLEPREDQTPVIAWFLLVARGENLSRADNLPFAFTKRAAHFFAEAPSDMTVLQAMRWAQMRALGAHDRAAREVSAFLDTQFGEFEPEWMAVMRFIVAHQHKLSLNDIGRIIQFIQDQRLRVVEVSASNITEVVEPLYPNFDIRQATLASVMNRVAAWESLVQKVRDNLHFREFPHPGMGLQDEYTYDLQQPDGPVIVRRLKNIHQLLREGQRMSNCAGTYGACCHQGISSVWIVQIGPGEKAARIGMIERMGNGSINQAVGKANTLPSPLLKRVVELWRSSLRSE